jgi:hypothetical protein
MWLFGAAYQLGAGRLTRIELTCAKAEMAAQDDKMAMQKGR